MSFLFWSLRRSTSSVFSLISLLRLPFSASSFYSLWIIDYSRPWSLLPDLATGDPEASPVPEPCRAPIPPWSLLRPDDIGIPPGPTPGPVTTGLCSERPFGPNYLLMSLAMFLAILSSMRSDALSGSNALATFQDPLFSISLLMS